jgi:XTP/dITP diphosphohydrolase
MRLANKVLLATTNRDKYNEFNSLFAAYPDVELILAERVIRNVGGLRFAERYETYLENAIAKARLVNQASHYPSLADDSGLEVQALEGKPGVRSHRYAAPISGLSQDEANTQFLLKELGNKESPARFVCTLALVIEGILIHSQAALEGSITLDPRGENGFGYDSVFVPKGSVKTLAEMTNVEKNAVSHRAKALHDLMSQVKSHGIVFAKP